MAPNNSNLVFGSLPEHHVLKSVYWGLVWFWFWFFFFIGTYAGKFLLFHLGSTAFPPEKSFPLFQASLA